MKEFIRDTGSIQLKDVLAPSETLVDQQEHALRRNHQALYDALVLDAKQRQSLVTIRSLGRRGMRIAALETSDNAKGKGYSQVPAFSSRWCQRTFVVPGYEQNQEPFLTSLTQILASIKPRVLIISSDSTISVVRQHREELERYTSIALAKEPALEKAINKEQTLEIAKQLDLAIPRGVHIRAVDELATAIHEVGLPAVVKPVEVWSWGEQQGMRLACRVVTTAEEAHQTVEELTRFGGTVLFQQFLTGRREGVHLLYAQNTVYAACAQWARRTSPPLGGVSTYRQTIPVPQDTGEQAERLIREINLEGYSEVEFRRDSAGKAYLMEINPRLSASVEVAVRTGADFPFLLYQWASGGQIDRLDRYQAGNWMRHLGGDIATTIQTIRERDRPEATPPAQALWEFFASFFVRADYDYIDWKDLLPAWKATSSFAFVLTKGVFKRALRLVLRVFKSERKTQD